MSKITNTRIYKGESLIKFPDDYIIIDIETTGLSPGSNEIIEIAAIKVYGNEIHSTFQSLIKPKAPINYFISNLTGITNAMVADANSVKGVLQSYVAFSEDSILIGHNVNFDINFLYDNCEKHLGYYLKNDFIDTMRLFKKTKIPVENYKLKTLCQKIAVQNNNAHRALSDCHATNSLFQYLKSQH